ncbi:hypothetical protein OIU78_007464 [Salix suchowensis]|nr:hypothetical protein OIU78_007464 [Salix suchowensis]
MERRLPSSRFCSEVERMAFNHVVVGSIPTDGAHNYFNVTGPGLQYMLLYTKEEMVRWPNVTYMGIPWVNGQEIAHILGLTPPHRNPKSQQHICYSDESDMCSGAIAVSSVCHRLSKGRSPYRA